MIDQGHNDNPNNVAQIFRNEVNKNDIFIKNLENISKVLINNFGNKTNILYAYLLIYNDELYSKFGKAGEVREFYKRIEEHKLEFENIYFYNIMSCSNIDQVETDFKNSALVSMNKVKIPKKYGGNHTEVIKLSELITTEVIKEEMIKVAGDRMLEPPPRYTQQIENNLNVNLLEIEKEHTKQKEIECKELTKQKELDVKQKELELEIKKMEYEMMKLQYSK